MAVRELGYDNIWRPWRYLVQQSRSTNNSDYSILQKNDVLLKNDSNPTPWQNAILKNGWNKHPDYETIQFSKTFDGIVYFRGSCAKGNGAKETVLFTLPDGFRPATTVFKSVLNNDFNLAVVAIYPSGNVVAKHNVDSKWMNLDKLL